jgi:filamentous hemagglutinin
LTRIRAEQISDIDYKQAVRVITLSNITLTGGAPATVDGVNLSTGNRVLVAGQSTGSQNGLYEVQTVGAGSNGTWIRSSDGNVDGEIEAGMIVMVTEGTIYKDTQWKLTTNDPIIIGTTALVFEQNSAYAFGNIYANGTAVLADAVGGTVTFTAGDNIAITGNNTSKTVTIGVTGISLNSIANGTSNVAVISSGGNVSVGVGGISNIAVFNSAGVDFTGNLLPTANVTYNLGSTNRRWKDLWLSNSTIYLGSATIFATEGNLNLPDNVYIGTAALSTHNDILSLPANTIMDGMNLVVADPDGNISSNGTVSAANITSDHTISSVGNITGGNMLTGGVVSATGNISGENLIIANQVIATGNVAGGNILTGGVVSATGNVESGANIVATANVAGGNLITLGIVSATGNVTGGNLITAGIVSTTGNVESGNVNTGIVSASANITGANLITGGQIISTGNVTGANLITGGQINATGNVNGAVINTAQVASTGGITITSSGSSDITLTAGGNINASSNYINNVTSPVQDNDAASKIYVDNLVATGLTYHEAVVATTTANLATITGGTITYTQPNGAGNGVGATITTTGSFDLIDTANVQTLGTRILVKDEGNAVLNGVYTWSNATAITRSMDADEYGTDSAQALSLNSYFFTESGNVNKGSAYVVAEPSGAITFGSSNIVFDLFSTSQVYSANTSAGISLIGTVFSAKVDNDTTAFDGSGNISVKPDANLVTPNIGAATGTSLSVTGNITGGNVNTGGAVLATGNVDSGNVNTGIVSASGNVTGANLITGGIVTATGNVTGGNLVTGGLITVTGNVTGGNIATAGLISATGNVTGGNIITAGLISATGNVTGGNILGNGAGLSGINAFSNIAVTGGNSCLADSIADTLTLTAGSGIVLIADAATDTITIATAGSGQSVFDTGGDLGLVTQVAVATEDLGLIIAAVTESYDLGSIVTSGIIVADSLIVPTYTVSTLPLASPQAQIIFVSNESGGAVLAFSDGTDWRRCTDRAIVT